MNAQAVVLVPLISALVEAAKKLGLQKRFCPPFAIAVGLALSFLSQNASPYEMVITGLMMGLGAVGLYENLSSGVEVVKNKIK